MCHLGRKKLGHPPSWCPRHQGNAAAPQTARRLPMTRKAKKKKRATKKKNQEKTNSVCIKEDKAGGIGGWQEPRLEESNSGDTLTATKMIPSSGKEDEDDDGFITTVIKSNVMAGYKLTPSFEATFLISPHPSGRPFANLLVFLESSNVRALRPPPPLPFHTRKHPLLHLNPSRIVNANYRFSPTTPPAPQTTHLKPPQPHSRTEYTTGTRL